MKTLSRWIAVALLAVAPLSAAPVALGAETAGAAGPVATAPAAPIRACVARNNLDEVAAKFISRCRKGGINREFPDQFRPKRLGEILGGKSDAEKKAWKLLNDGRFVK